jgi:serine/threonine protein kinase/Tol biopolymer transport system component
MGDHRGYPPMQIAPGTRFGPFEILSLVGAGGMGEVYRARDTRLHRDVAIKVLTPFFVGDEGAAARFEREARAVAALNHPNILALHDIGREGSTAFAVTELLEGSPLRERLASGPLPVRKVIEYGVQIAGALAAAHDRGIVHRDIKPENIFVTADGRIKLLDFGLARVTPAVDTVSATLQKPNLTAPGAIFGTPGYMAPEQVRGASIDHRADIFSLGAVLYEMLAGHKSFDGETIADSMHAILHADPAPIDRDIPPHLDRIVRRCLEKHPNERFQSARDLAFALETAATASGQQPSAAKVPSRWKFVALAAAALATIAVAAALLLNGRRAVTAAPVPAPVARFGIFASTTWSDSASISPDGRYVVYSGGAGASDVVAGRTASESPGGRPAGFAPVSGRFWLRKLDTLEARGLSETEAAVPLFFWSPDSRFLGYRAGNTLMVRDVSGGAPRVLAEVTGSAQGVAWSRQGDIIVAVDAGLYRLPSSGGTPALLMRTEPGRELWRGSPSFLPDGKRFLFTVLRNGGGEQALETRVGSLDGGELATVTTGAVGATYAGGSLLFGAGGALYAQAFDEQRLKLTGERVEVARSVAQDWRTGRLAAHSSDNGILVYRSAPRGDARFVVVDRSGRQIRSIGSPDSFTNFTVSPDEQRIIATRRDPLSGHLSLWMIDAARGVTSLLTETTDTDDADDPTWMPDGQNVAYRHGSRLVVRRANGGPERTLVPAESYPDSFSRDGRFLVYGQPRGNVFEQWALDVTQPGAKPIPLVSGVTLADEGRIAPNGKWLASHSNETGTAQISIIPFPPTGERWQVSRDGGVQPRWSADGNQLFYLDPEGRLMVVAMAGSDPRKAAAPEVLFSTGVVPSDALDQFTPLKTGFLVRAPVAAGEATAVQVIVNWRTLLR